MWLPRASVFRIREAICVYRFVRPHPWNSKWSIAVYPSPSTTIKSKFPVFYAFPARTRGCEPFVVFKDFKQDTMRFASPISERLRLLFALFSQRQGHPCSYLRGQPSNNLRKVLKFAQWDYGYYETTIKTCLISHCRASPYAMKRPTQSSWVSKRFRLLSGSKLHGTHQPHTRKLELTYLLTPTYFVRILQNVCIALTLLSTQCTCHTKKKTCRLPTRKTGKSSRLFSRARVVSAREQAPT